MSIWAGRSSVIVGGTVFFLLSATSRAPAYTLTTCPANNPFHVYGHEYDSGRAHGEYLTFLTYNMNVPDPESAFSLSHAYMFLNSVNGNDADPADGDTFLEDGYYKGLGGGSAPRNVATPHYYRTFEDQYGYHEGDDTEFPDVGSKRLYQLTFVGHNNSLGTDDWSYYYENTTTARDTVHISGLPYAHALAGGEVQGDSTSYTQMEAHTYAPGRVQDQNGVWHTWDASLVGTNACQSAGVNFTLQSAYQQFAVTGQA